MSLSVRNSARVVLFDEHDHILLFKYEDPDAIDLDRPRGSIFWITPGGGLEAGETFEQAAVRELFEETGISVSSVGPWLWTRDLTLRFAKGPMAFHERFFFVRTSRRPIDTSGHQEAEAGGYRECKWWSLDELRSSTEVFFPEKVAELVAPLLSGDLPDAPVRIGV